MLRENVVMEQKMQVLMKDDVLNDLADRCNIAQFVSFSPDTAQRYARINGRPPNEQYSSVEEAVSVLLRAAESRAINIRSFRPGDSKGQELIIGLTTVGDIASAIRMRASSGFYTIANELIPLDDGGVSGVSIGDVIEFAPADTPKCVEKPGVASLPRAIGLGLLTATYGFEPAIDLGPRQRVEFSLHPIRRGIRREHTIIWELESAPSLSGAIGKWPNRYSEFIGDKVYGLLIAHLLGFPVPRTTVINRHVAPFSFGTPTGTSEVWIRTAPHVPIAGKYPTLFGWSDPYKMMSECDAAGNVLPTILAQESVEFVFSGAAQTTTSGLVVEGGPGRGDAFMIGEKNATAIPVDLNREIKKIHDSLCHHLESVKFEWVWDGSAVWIVQLHARRKTNGAGVIFEGPAERYLEFDATLGLEALRNLAASIRGKHIGVVVVGEVGITSHLGDVLREAEIPSRLERRSQVLDPATAASGRA